MGEQSRKPGTIRFGVDFIAHLNQPGQVAGRAKTGIQAQGGWHGVGIGRIFSLEAPQALAQLGDFCLPKGQALPLLRQPILRFGHIGLATF